MGKASPMSGRSGFNVVLCGIQHSFLDSVMQEFVQS
jgi:hypothetical protein